MRSPRFIAVLALLPLVVACDSLMSIPSESHPPQITKLELSSSSIHDGDPLWFEFTYHDQGADIVQLYVRDCQSGTKYQAGAT